MNLLTTAEVAKELDLSQRQVERLIKSGALKAELAGPILLIKARDIEAVRVRKLGRPRK